MGDYTELYLAVELKSSTPQRVIEALGVMSSTDEDKQDRIPRDVFTETNLFNLPRSLWMFHCTSYYFAGQSFCLFKHDSITSTNFLTVRADVKNYEKQWETFIDWIAPWVEPRGHIGHYRYEYDACPILLYAFDGQTIEWVATGLPDDLKEKQKESEK